MKTIILDPGHGMGNRRASRFDPGAVAGGVREADIAMTWANELRAFLQARGYRIIRTRRDNEDPAQLLARAKIARDYKGELMLSFHCNAADGNANGTETFYRGEENKPLALALNKAVYNGLGTRSRGVKLEAESQHGRLAIMAFQPCFLIELGFIDHAGDRAKMLDDTLRKATCEAIADILCER